VLGGLSELLYLQGRYAEAATALQRDLQIQEKVLGANDPAIASMLDDFSALLLKTNHTAEAAQAEERAKAIRAKAVSAQGIDPEN
jgi:tetratricopeptide repeat protein